MYDHTVFIHKTLLDLYVSMKDTALDFVDEWEDIRKLVVSSTDHNNDAEAGSKKAIEKRRIYSKRSGITAADVNATPLSGLEIQQLQDRVFLMAEVRLYHACHTRRTLESSKEILKVESQLKIIERSGYVVHAKDHWFF